MEIAPLLQPHLEAIRELCREFGVVRLEVFGSVQTYRFDPATSDIDFLVEYPRLPLRPVAWEAPGSSRSALKWNWFSSRSCDNECDAPGRISAQSRGNAR